MEESDFEILNTDLFTSRNNFRQVWYLCNTKYWYNSECKWWFNFSIRRVVSFEKMFDDIMLDAEINIEIKNNILFNLGELKKLPVEWKVALR